MMAIRTRRRVWPVLLVLPPLLACSLFAQQTQPTPVPPTQAAATPVPQPSPTATVREAAATPMPQPSPTATAREAAAPIRQWAAHAEASSEYDNPDWAARQATGAPDTFECGDLETAWASAGENTVEWINVYYQTPVYPTEIRIIQSYNPDQVVQVDLIDMQGRFVTVYTGQPRAVETPCPYTLVISGDWEDTLVQGVRITVDQSVLGLGWNEIDAVEIVGVPGEGTPVRPSRSAP